MLGIFGCRPPQGMARENLACVQAGANDGRSRFHGDGLPVPDSHPQNDQRLRADPAPRLGRRPDPRDHGGNVRSEPQTDRALAIPPARTRGGAASLRAERRARDREEGGGRGREEAGTVAENARVVGSDVREGWGRRRSDVFHGRQPGWSREGELCGRVLCRSEPVPVTACGGDWNKVDNRAGEFRPTLRRGCGSSRERICCRNDVVREGRQNSRSS
mmetsp:Transcript_4/g.12  ORF Transcript_4/g.12 Transcript_4/m.12 type:complete len:217 (-) Transcript_4:229-879(-)